MLKKHSEQNTAKFFKKIKILHCTSWYVKHPIIYRVSYVSFTLLSNGGKIGFKTHVPQHLIHSKENPPHTLPPTIIVQWKMGVSPRL